MRRIALLLATLLSLAIPGRLTAVGNFAVGFSAVETTPDPANGYAHPLAKVSLGGYGISCPTLGFGRRPPTGIHDKVWARAMAIESGGSGFILVMVDVVGAGNRTTKAIQQQAAAALNIPASNIFVGESHSHSSPDLVGLWSQMDAVKNSDFLAYRDFVIAKAVAAVTQAWNSRQPANLYASSGSLNRSSNRRLWGFTDQEMVILDAMNASTGTRIGTLVSWAAHPTVLPKANRELSRDYPGYAVDALEKNLGAGKVVFWNGAFGDAVPGAPTPSPDFAGAEDVGDAVASAALTTMTAARTLVGPGVRIASKGFRSCISNWRFALALALGCMDYNLVPPPLGCFTNQAVESSVTYIRLGTEVQIALTPGESLTRLAAGDANVQGVKDYMKPGTHHLWLNPSSDFLGYLIPCDEFNHPPPGDDKYEEGVSVGRCADSWISMPLKQLIQADSF
jgi:hypothetical protein